MYIYSVTIYISKEAEIEWVHFMQSKHIKDVLDTGYFTTASMRKEISKDKSESVAYNIEYSTNTPSDFDAYQQKCAPALQKDVMDRFAGKFTAERRFYNVVFKQ